MSTSPSPSPSSDQSSVGETSVNGLVYLFSLSGETHVVVDHSPELAPSIHQGKTKFRFL